MSLGDRDCGKLERKKDEPLRARPKGHNKQHSSRNSSTNFMRTLLANNNVAPGGGKLRKKF